MRYFIGLVILLVLFNGCSSKDQDFLLLKNYEKNKLNYKNLQKTEKVQLYDNNTTKALLTATYLYTPTIKINDTQEEKFIVGVYLEEDESNQLGGAYRLKLGTQAPLKVEALSKESKYLKHVSFVTQWNSYYLVTFPHTSKRSFMLTFESDRYGKDELHFSKVAKYNLSE